VYGKATDFCVLILYLDTLLKLFVVSMSFWLDFFGSLRYMIKASVNRNNLTISLPICIPFIFSSCLIALARNSRTLLNQRREIGHPCLISDFRENGFSFSLLSMMLAVGLSYITFIMLRYIPSPPSFLGAFMMKLC
jgi:hypothetical protein